MRSDIHGSRFYIECDCRSSEHILVLESYDYEPNPARPGEIECFEVEAYFAGNWRAPWYKRIWYAFEFVFYRKKFTWGETVGISERNINQLEEIVNYFNKKKMTNRDQTIKSILSTSKDAGLDFSGYEFEDDNILGTISELVCEIKELKSNANTNNTRG